MADNRKLAAGILNLPASARQELAQRAQDMEREGVVGMLRKAGKEMYDNPIVNTAIGFSPVLGDIQAAGETMSALNRGAPWQETAGYAVGMLPFVPVIGKTVWHGSPHTFDKFDLSKIGTGEGVQAYGHGLYLAESPDVAQGYQKKLSQLTKLVDGEVTKDLSSSVVGTQLKQFGGDAEKTKNYFLAKAAEYEKMGQSYKPALSQAEQYKNYANYVDDLSKKSFEQNTGSLYKVDLPDEQIAKMLDWDKPLSEQAPEVQQAISNMTEQAMKNATLSGKAIYESQPKNMTGGQWHQAFSRLTGTESNQPITAQMLNQAGIPGIQYLDQASRGAGEGTRNYVVFSDEIPQILERNNIPVNK